MRLGQIASEDKDYLWQQTERVYETVVIRKENKEAGGAGVVVMKREELSKIHDAIRHRLIMKAFSDIGLDKDISQERIICGCCNKEKTSTQGSGIPTRIQIESRKRKSDIL